MVATIQITHRTVGPKTLDQYPNDLVMELLTEHLSVADLIAQVVEEEIQNHHILRQWGQQADAETQAVLNRQHLTPDEVNAQAQTGVVKYPAEPEGATIIVKQEVKKALRAFENNVYILLVDGYQPDTLEEQISLSPNSKITFLRLTPLVGG